MPLIENSLLTELEDTRRNLKEFAYRVTEMMDAQSAYFKDRKQSDLINAKRLEREVRAKLKAFDDAEHAPVAAQTAMDLDLP